MLVPARLLRTGDYVDKQPVPTCLRNHAFLQEIKTGRGRILGAPDHVLAYNLKRVMNIMGIGPLIAAMSAA